MNGYFCSSRKKGAIKDGRHKGTFAPAPNSDLRIWVTAGPYQGFSNVTRSDTLCLLKSDELVMNSV